MTAQCNGETSQRVRDLIQDAAASHSAGAACPESRRLLCRLRGSRRIEARTDTTDRRHGLDREDHKQGIAVSLSRQHFEY